MKKYMLLLLLLRCISSSLVVGAEARPRGLLLSENVVDALEEGIKRIIKPLIMSRANTIDRGDPIHIDDRDGYITRTDQGHVKLNGILFRLEYNEGTIRGEIVKESPNNFVKWAYDNCRTRDKDDEAKEENIQCTAIYNSLNQDFYAFYSARTYRDGDEDQDQIVRSFFPEEGVEEIYMLSATIVEGKGLLGETDT